MPGPYRAYTECKNRGIFPMAKIAIMGFGTVGSGVLEVCRRNAASIARRAGEPVEVKYILDVRDFSGSPDAALFTKSIDTILNDPEIKVVVETIGGTKFAYRMCAGASRAGAASAPPTRRWSQPTAQSCWPLPKSTARPSCLRPASAAARRSSPRCTSAWPPTISAASAASSTARRTSC